MDEGESAEFQIFLGKIHWILDSNLLIPVVGSVANGVHVILMAICNLMGHHRPKFCLCSPIPSVVLQNENEVLTYSRFWCAKLQNSRQLICLNLIHCSHNELEWVNVMNVVEVTWGDSTFFFFLKIWISIRIIWIWGPWIFFTVPCV